MFSVVSTYLFTRLIPSEEYGVFGIVLAINGPIGVVLTEWLTQPIGRYYAEYYEKDQLDIYKESVVTLIYVVLLILAILAVLTTFALLIFFGFIPRPLVFAGALVALVVQSLFAIGIRMLPVSMQSKPYAVSLSVSSGLSVGISFFLISSFGANAAWLLWGPALAQLVLLPYVYNHLHLPLLKSFSNICSSPTELTMTVRRFGRYGIPMTIWFFASSLLDMADRYVIQISEGSTSVAIYTVNYGLITQSVRLITGPFWAASIPILLFLWAQHDSDRIRKTLEHFSDIYVILGCMLLGGVALIGEPLVKMLVGPEFREGYVILLPVLAGQLIWGLSILGNKGVELAEKPHLMVLSVLCAAVVNLVLNLLFIPQFGYIAAAYTTLVGYLVYLVLIWFQSRRFVMWHIPWLSFLTSVTTSVCSIVFSRVLVSSHHMSSVSMVLLAAILFLVAYGGITTLLRRQTVLAFLTNFQ